MAGDLHSLECGGYLKPFFNLNWAWVIFYYYSFYFVFFTHKLEVICLACAGYVQNLTIWICMCAEWCTDFIGKLYNYIWFW